MQNYKRALLNRADNEQKGGSRASKFKFNEIFFVLRLNWF
jgi:hypothetical protein